MCDMIATPAGTEIPPRYRRDGNCMPPKPRRSIGRSTSSPNYRSRGCSPRGRFAAIRSAGGSPSRSRPTASSAISSVRSRGNADGNARPRDVLCGAVCARRRSRRIVVGGQDEFHRAGTTGRDRRRRYAGPQRRSIAFMEGRLTDPRGNLLITASAARARRPGRNARASADAAAALWTGGEAH
jgi:hypothetical protein